METYEIVCAMALGLLLDVAMGYVIWRWVLPMPTRRRRAVGVAPFPIFYARGIDSATGLGIGVAGWTHRVSGDDPFTQGRTFNPATGLPMVDGTYDAAGNPHGVNLHERFNHGFGDSGSGGFGAQIESFGVSDSGSSFDSFGSSCFDSGFGGMHDW